jgi:hypothetical protein
MQMQQWRVNQCSKGCLTDCLWQLLAQINESCVLSVTMPSAAAAAQHVFMSHDVPAIAAAVQVIRNDT